MLEKALQQLRTRRTAKPTHKYGKSDDIHLVGRRGAEPCTRQSNPRQSNELLLSLWTWQMVQVQQGYSYGKTCFPIYTHDTRFAG